MNMLTVYNVTLLVVLVLPVYILYRLFSKTRIPKGLKELPKVRGWPFIGVLLSVKEPMSQYLFGLAKKHGPIFTITMGCRDIVVMNSGAIMRKTLKDMGNIFSGRWKNIIVQTVAHNSGVIFTDKEWWATQRSFVLKVLRDFGFGKQRSQEIVNYECAILLKEIEESCGKVVSARFLFPKFMVNVIAKLVMNMRFERSDKDFQTMTRILEEVTNRRDFSVTLLLMYPILESYPVLSHLLLLLCGRDQKLNEMHNYIKTIVAEHERRFNSENEGEDVIDMFLKEKQKLEQNNVKDHTFTDWQLIRVTFELFGAGYETTSTTLAWSMVLLAKHPDVQEKIHREILDVIGTGRTPALADKKSLVYTQAVMDEIFRVSSVVPLSIPHRVFENTEVDGYFIPKDSIIFPNTYSSHRDAHTWENPFEFYPEHFLTEVDGVMKYTPHDDLMPFGVGKRQCLGESLARLEYFTFLTSILQQFKIKFPEDVTDEEYRRIIRGTDGGIRAPLRSDVIFETWQ